MSLPPTPASMPRPAHSPVVAIAVLSADGRLTRGSEPGSGFASTEDQQLFRSTLGECRALIMGRTTYEVARAAMNLSAGGPMRYVLTSRPEAFDGVPRALEFTAEAPEAVVSRCRTTHPGMIGLLGGSRVYAAFARAGLVDEWRITLEPALFGVGLSLLAEAAPQRLALAEHRLLNTSTLYLRYRTAGEFSGADPHRYT